jgi:hypothetical protein
VVQHGLRSIRRFETPLNRLSGDLAVREDGAMVEFKGRADELSSGRRNLPFPGSSSASVDVYGDRRERTQIQLGYQKHRYPGEGVGRY